MTLMHTRVPEALASRLKWLLIYWLVAANQIYSRYFDKKSIIAKEKDCIVVTVAFNKPRLIKIQLESLKKYFKTDFSFLIYDNSTDARASQELEKFCRNNSVIYIKPRTKLAGRINPSLDHAIALDWCLEAITMLKTKPKYALFLDHDIFLTADWEISAAIAPTIGITAPKQERKGIAYYWPGLMVINTELTNLKLLSFLPEPGLDTGGKLGRQALRYKIETQEMRHCGYISTLTGSKINNEENNFDELLMSNQIVEAYGPWLHLINGSCWRGKGRQDQSLNYIISQINNSIESR